MRGCETRKREGEEQDESRDGAGRGGSREGVGRWGKHMGERVLTLRSLTPLMYMKGKLLSCAHNLGKMDVSGFPNWTTCD